MEFIEDYKWPIIAVVIIIVIGVIYSFSTFTKSESTHYLTVVSNEVDRFNLSIKDSKGEVEFLGEVGIPFTVLLDDDIYVVESWYYDNSTRYGYKATVNLDRDKNVWMLV